MRLLMLLDGLKAESIIEEVSGIHSFPSDASVSSWYYWIYSERRDGNQEHLVPVIL